VITDDEAGSVVLNVPGRRKAAAMNGHAEHLCADDRGDQIRERLKVVASERAIAAGATTKLLLSCKTLLGRLLHLSRCSRRHSSAASAPDRSAGLVAEIIGA
jgi:hypothetical protein